MKTLKKMNLTDLINFKNVLIETLDILIEEKQKHPEKKINIDYKPILKIQDALLTFIKYNYQREDYETDEEYEKRQSDLFFNCWEWQGDLDKNDNPIYIMPNKLASKGRSSISVRKNLFQEAEGRFKYSSCKLVMTCGNEKCVSPTHMKEVRY